MNKRFGIASALFGAVALLLVPKISLAADDDLAQQIFDTMVKVHGVHEGFRIVHAKGIICQGTFEPTKEAAGLSKAAHFQAAVPVTIRYSDGSPDPMIPDNSGNSGPRGFAIRFNAPGGNESDIVSMSHNGFVVGNGEDFLALQKSVVATDPAKPHPWPVEQFLMSHPLALKFVTDNAIHPESFATQPFYGNNAFLFTNKDGVKQPGRYKIIPDAGAHFLSADDEKGKSENYLMDDLKTRLAKEPIKYHLIVQLPNAGDSTNDGSIVWPDDRKTIDMGTITVTKVDADSDKLQKELAFDPTNLTDGIETSDDKLPELRSQVYALSVQFRKQVKK